MRNGLVAVVVVAGIIAVGMTAPAVARGGGGGGPGFGAKGPKPGGFSGGNLAGAHVPPGFRHGNKQGWTGRTPPGWRGYGEKTGWGNGRIPPGLR